MIEILSFIIIIGHNPCCDSNQCFFYFSSLHIEFFLSFLQFMIPFCCWFNLLMLARGRDGQQSSSRLRALIPVCNLSKESIIYYAKKFMCMLILKHESEHEEREKKYKNINIIKSLKKVRKSWTTWIHINDHHIWAPL